MDACQTCRGLESLIRRHGIEQVILRGRNDNGIVTWIVDVITVDADGHKSSAILDEAMNYAISEAVSERLGDCRVVMVE